MTIHHNHSLQELQTVIQTFQFEHVSFYEEDDTYLFFDAKLHQQRVELRVDVNTLEFCWRTYGIQHIEDVEWLFIQNLTPLLEQNEESTDYLTEEMRNPLMEMTKLEMLEEISTQFEAVSVNPVQCVPPQNNDASSDFDMVWFS